MAQKHELMFYELMWRIFSQGIHYPLPWWVQQYFRHWSDSYDGGLFNSKEAAFASNANYRYWNMIGVKDHHQESLIGQAGEIEPVYDRYALGFFLYDKLNRRLHLPQYPSGTAQSSLDQSMEAGFLPTVKTLYRTDNGLEVEATALASVFGNNQKSVVMADYRVRDLARSMPSNYSFCVALMPAGPSGFQRHDRAGRYVADRRIGQLRLDANRQFVSVNAGSGPVFKQPADFFGLYGNGGSEDPEHYVEHNPFVDLSNSGNVNGFDHSTDHVAGLCCGVFGWDLDFNATGEEFVLEVKLPVDDYRGEDELTALNQSDGMAMAAANRTFWEHKLNQTGTRLDLPDRITHLNDLYRLCRSNLLILADNGQIHPGPTIYDDFWIRDSSIEGVAVAMAGDLNLAATQFGTHYPNKFNLNSEWIGPVNTYGFFGGHHEKNDREWDSNGEALWAIGRFDRINNPLNGFGLGMYYPYMLEGARWLRDNRSQYGLLHSGWSAEHIGDKSKPHYWDDFWGIAGLYETARLAERINAREIGEIWSIYDALRGATVDSIRWVLGEQARMGRWETFIPTGPGDVNRLDSTMIGLLAYFHPCRLYMGNKLGSDIDFAARMTLETIWSHFIDSGGFRHDSAWNCYGPYLTLQLAHAFLLIGDKHRMDVCLGWTVGNAAYSRVTRVPSSEHWEVVQGAWNEQHCYPVSKDFAEFPSGSWYMGDIPHGWAAAEFLTLMRDILFFEADEDDRPHIYIAPGVMEHWLADNQEIGIDDAPTIFGQHFGYRMAHRQSSRRVEMEITQDPGAGVEYRFPCPFGNRIEWVEFDGHRVSHHADDRTLYIPSGTRRIVLGYT
jgi:hypothetical protein